MLSSHPDMTRQPTDRERRRCTTPHLRAVLNGIGVGILTFNKALAVLFVNERLTSVLDIQPAMSARASSVADLLDGSAALDDTSVQAVHEACLAATEHAGEHWSSASLVSGSNARLFTMHVSALDDGYWVAAFEEVTAKRAAETSAIEQAMCDPLTGLPNRQLFENRLVHDLTAAGPDGHAALLLLDLDRFKIINDTLGHAVGDGLLRLVAKRLRSLLRSSDVLSRLGGDEFGLLVSPSPGDDHLAVLATRIVELVGRPYLVEGHLVNIGVSIGIARAPNDGREHRQLMRNADLALYHAKNSGRSTYSFFKAEMDERASARRALEIDLRKALALGEFELHYQPQIDLERHVVVGFEALLRWHHPARGMISPADFIPLAEEIGLIVPLGEWVLRQACSQAKRWPHHVSVAVNVSPRQFEDPARLLNSVSKALANSGLPGNRLEIEITESVLLGNQSAVLQALHQLRAMQVSVAMDDFGTGYSSLSQLHSFPFDKIKIDRSFVKDRGDTASQNAIIRAITALGVSLGMSTIAEGVETTEQLNRIRTEGCTSVQGYLFSRPLPAQQIDRLLADFANHRPYHVMSIP